jgi:hypothetical protein
MQLILANEKAVGGRSGSELFQFSVPLIVPGGKSLNQ